MGWTSGIIAAALLAACFLPAAGRGQTLAESAQKEKERREALTAGTAVVVTNADLSKVKKKSAVALPSAPEPAAGTVRGAAARAAGIPASVLEANSRAVFDQNKSDLESQWNVARERTSLLEIKLLSLQQQSAHAVNADARDAVGKDIESTTRTLADARLEEKKAKAELDKFPGAPADVKR